MPNLVQTNMRTKLASRYGYTWRGIRRPRDREFGIGGGEYLVVDKATNQVLGVKRTFNSTLTIDPRFTNWFAARECIALDKVQGIPPFINRVLHPNVHVNDHYLEVQHHAEYHAEILKSMEIRHD